jgi:hypothetical protein
MDSELETIVSNEVYLLFVEEFEHLHLSSWTDFLQKKKRFRYRVYNSY